jgi:solute:Na+ symporter, SSS family
LNALDYAVLVCTIVGIAAYGLWRTRGRNDLSGYLRGRGNSSWIVIGLSVMATQASAITFLSTPGQGYQSGIGFVQNYFGTPLALIIIAAVFLPIYRRLRVYTAYEYLGQRFDAKTRLLGAGLFLVPRGLGAGITIYAPAIVLSSVFGWRLDATIVCTGLACLVYTVAGGNDAVSVTQKYQIGIIFAGMIAAFMVLIARLPAELSFTDALALTGRMHKLDGVDFSPSIHKRYTFWSGSIAAVFLMLSYFGTDQSQVQRYMSTGSLRECRLGLMFNAVLKIPMQFFILLLGVMLFAFFQFERPPVFFNEAAWNAAAMNHDGAHLHEIEERFNAIHEKKQEDLRIWLGAEHTNDSAGAAAALERVLDDQRRSDGVREEAKKALSATDPPNDADYVFIRYLPHGLIGLLVAAFFAAAISSKAAELNALASTTTIDVYRFMIKRDGTDAHYVAASKWFTAAWGIVAIGFALGLRLAENLIQALNIVGSIFYGPVLGLFLAAFFFRRIGGTAVFWGAIAAQALVIALYFSISIGYLWYNFVGAAACVAFSLVFQAVIGTVGGRRSATISS